MKQWRIGSISILFFFLFVFIGQGQESLQDPEELYDSSMGLYHQGRLEEAVRGFSKIIHSPQSHRLVSTSQYMIGLCYLKMEKYEEAVQHFELYLKTNPNGDRVKEADRGIQISKEKLIGRSFSDAKSVKRRVCAQIFDLNARSFEEVEKRVKDLKHAGVNTLILRVFQNKGGGIYKFATPQCEEGVYFKTEYAPVVDNLLDKIREITHRNGLELFAWMTTRYANYGLEGRPEYRCISYNFESKQMEMGRGFNLFHPDVLKRLEGIFRDLGRYSIDGILLQDDLILKHNEDFSTDANKTFLKEFGYLPHPDLFYIDPYLSESGKYFVKAYTDRFRSWADWKSRWLMNVAKQLMNAARESNPNLKFALNLYYETVLNHFNALAWFSQSLPEAQGKEFDYYAVMAYHRQAMKELNIGERKTIDLMSEVAQKAVKAVGQPHRVLMKVQILDWKNSEVVPQKEVEEILTRILDHGEVSLAFVPYVDQFPLHQLKKKWISTSLGGG